MFFVVFVYNRHMILGIDEAGRGPWAGPLVVGAVILGGAEIEGLTDSKKLTKKRREALYPIIHERAVAYATGWVSVAELDEIGMSRALRLATRRAVEQIYAPYSEIIIDGTVNFLADTGKGKYVQTMKKADLLVPSVSAASILAKVERDWFMAEQDEIYPGYGFASHAGYGTAKHVAAIEKLGVTPLHRLSFAPLAKYRTDNLDSARSAHSSRSTLFSPNTTGIRLKRSAESSLGSLSQPPQRSADLDEASAANKRKAETTKSIGDRAESVVADRLESDGHEIIARNWWTKWCEIDVVSKKGDTIYFTEVKYRKNAKFGDGLSAITKKKQQQMHFAAELFVTKFPEFSERDMALLGVSVAGDPSEIQEIVEVE